MLSAYRPDRREQRGQLKQQGFISQAALDQAQAILMDLIARYDLAETPYRARASDDDFAHLARSAAWGVTGGDEA